MGERAPRHPYFLPPDNRYIAHPAMVGQIDVCTLGLATFEECADEYLDPADRQFHNYIHNCSGEGCSHRLDKVFLGDVETRRLLVEQFDICFPMYREKEKVFIDCRGIEDPGVVRKEDRLSGHISYQGAAALTLGAQL